MVTAKYEAGGLASVELSIELKTLKDYLRELRETRRNKPPQIREALKIYIELWEQAKEGGIVRDDDPIEDALSKVEKKGVSTKLPQVRDPERRPGS